MCAYTVFNSFHPQATLKPTNPELNWNPHSNLGTPSVFTQAL